MPTWAAAPAMIVTIACPLWRVTYALEVRAFTENGALVYRTLSPLFHDCARRAAGAPARRHSPQ